MAAFMREIREAFPGEEIVHNQRYSQAGGLSGGMPVSEHVRSAIEQADLIEVEGSYNDGGLVPGGGPVRLGHAAELDRLHPRPGQGRGPRPGGPQARVRAGHLPHGLHRARLHRPCLPAPAEQLVERGLGARPRLRPWPRLRRPGRHPDGTSSAGSCWCASPAPPPAPVAVDGRYERLDGTPAGAVVTVPAAGGLVLRVSSGSRRPGDRPLPRRRARSTRSRRARRA